LYMIGHLCAAPLVCTSGEFNAASGLSSRKGNS
jgi:hypothetical protein